MKMKMIDHIYWSAPWFVSLLSDSHHMVKKGERESGKGRERRKEEEGRKEAETYSLNKHLRRKEL